MGQALSTGRAGGQHMDESTVARQSSSKVLAAAHEHNVAKDEGLAASTDLPEREKHELVDIRAIPNLR